MTKQVEQGLVIDASRLTLRDFERFTNSASTNDTAVLRETFAKVVVSWDRAGDPTDPETYADLSVLDFVQVSRDISKALADALAAKN